MALSSLRIALALAVTIAACSSAAAAAASNPQFSAEEEAQFQALAAKFEALAAKKAAAKKAVVRRDTQQPSLRTDKG